MRDKLEALETYGYINSLSSQEVFCWLYPPEIKTSAKKINKVMSSNIAVKIESENNKELEALNLKLGEDSNDVEALKLRGMILYNSNQLEMAFKDFSDIGVEFRDSIAWAHMGFIKYKWKDNAGALIFLDRALEIDPANQLARLKRAEAFFELKKSSEALVDLNTLIENAKKIQSKALLARAKLNQHQGLIKEAIADCEMVLKDGDDPVVQQFLEDLKKSTLPLQS